MSLFGGSAGGRILVVRFLDHLLILLGTAGAGQFGVPLPTRDEPWPHGYGLAVDPEFIRGYDWDDWEIELLSRRPERLGPPLEWLPDGPPMGR
ncbi:hypothetical protein [Kitasatospora sp. NBC_01266]|uniref:hypothetical protein n=1 Tax=Kitasatospora sp. NBC_01266 TaxID=2903572 RepID=UPI002E354767|nr:hypothetical protein [Kitasatospora sp. NBC_01266]